MLYAPTGVPIQGTIERLSGVAIVNGAERNEDGTLELDYSGDTDIWWDEQKTARHNDERMFVDEDGTTWLESQVLTEAEFEQRRTKAMSKLPKDERA